MHYQLSSYRAVPHLNIYHHIFTYTIQLIYRLLYTTYIHITQASKYIHLDNHYFFIYLKSLFNHDASIILYLNRYLFILNYFLIPPISHLFLYSTFQLFILNIHISIYPFIYFPFVHFYNYLLCFVYFFVHSCNLSVWSILSFSLFIYLPIYSFVFYPFIQLSLYIFILNLSVYLTFVCLYIYPSISQFNCIYLSMYLWYANCVT